MCYYPWIYFSCGCKIRGRRESQCLASLCWNGFDDHPPDCDIVTTTRYLQGPSKCYLCRGVEARVADPDADWDRAHLTREFDNDKFGASDFNPIQNLSFFRQNIRTASGYHSRNLLRPRLLKSHRRPRPSLEESHKNLSYSSSQIPRSSSRRSSRDQVTQVSLEGQCTERFCGLSEGHLGLHMIKGCASCMWSAIAQHTAQCAEGSCRVWEGHLGPHSEVGCAACVYDPNSRPRCEEGLCRLWEGHAGPHSAMHCMLCLFNPEHHGPHMLQCAKDTCRLSRGHKGLHSLVGCAWCAYDPAHPGHHATSCAEVSCRLWEGHAGPHGFTPTHRWCARVGCAGRFGHAGPHEMGTEDMVPRGLETSRDVEAKLVTVSKLGVEILEQLNRKVLIMMGTSSPQRGGRAFVSVISGGVDGRASTSGATSVALSGQASWRQIVTQKPILRQRQPAHSMTEGPLCTTPTSSTIAPHEALAYGAGQIRLFRLHPDAGDGHIQGHFIHVDIVLCPAYTTLSYAWGDVSKTRKITIDEMSYEVGENLWWFLHFQSNIISDPRLYWIDAICINQSNVHEVNHQVSLMKQIYTNAADVYTWLGPEYEDSNLAMDFLAKKALKSPKPQASGGYRRLWTQREGKALRDLCERQYWRRMWIIQEIIHARGITVWCGTRSFDWDVLNKLYLALKTLEDESWFAHHDLVIHVLQSSAFVMVWQRAHWRHHETPTPTLRSLIEIFQDWQCTDLRDKVYALVGMADQDSAVTPDYSRTACQIYHDVLHKGPAADDRFRNLLAQLLGIPGDEVGLPRPFFE